jgi:NAD(P)H-hydrate epimerase
MQAVVTADEMSIIDSQAQSEFGIPELVLMENAGQRAWAELRSRLDRQRPQEIIFLAGTGNNGGDALVMARACKQDNVHLPRIILSKEPEKGPAKTHLATCRKLGIPVEIWKQTGTEGKGEEGHSRHERPGGLLSGADWIVDGLLGTGISGAARDPVGEIAEAIAASEPRARVAAVDVPSGLWDGYREGMPIVTADLTLTLGLPKRSLYLPAARRHAGSIRPTDIGFPRALIEDPGLPGTLLDEKSVSAFVPPLASEDYKHRRGVVALFAGAPGTLGAAILSANATGRSGVGLVRLFVDPELYPSAAGACTSIMVGQCDPSFPPLLEEYDAYVAGPGWSDNPLRLPLLENCIASGLPGVFDAGALALLPKGFRGEGVNTVLTPHPGEFARLAGVSRDEVLADPLPAVLEVASDRASVVILKSHVTYIGAPDGRYALYDGVNGVLGTGGTGDILAGIIAGFLARGVDAFEAAAAAVAFHGFLGRRLYGRKGWFLAEDMLEEISSGLADLVGTRDYSELE